MLSGSTRVRFPIPMPCEHWATQRREIPGLARGAREEEEEEEEEAKEEECPARGVRSAWHDFKARHDVSARAFAARMSTPASQNRKWKTKKRNAKQRR
ncbi:hypothetical protein PAN31108_02621 [Pandoraea anhela]|uniref:Uncharacterized protein n=2 Tax=Pandoraea anhela TaxID=2508295 RepID=A0A5E4VFL5_9BURK|nr:hypothetical protein PAN31108_02621 [Pandoraea anhela]